MKRTFTAFMLLIGLACFAAPASAQVAPGVTQSEAHTATVTGNVLKSDGSPVSQAAVKLIGPAVLTGTTDASGSFIFTTVPWGTYQVIVASSLGTASRSNVSVNGDIHVAIQYPRTSTLRTIANVTTTSSGAHINVTAASIASVTPSDYAFQGNPTWTPLLNSIPGVLVNGDLQGGQQIGDFLVGSPITPQVLSINGAMPYETSVTLDGMPLESQTTIGNPGAGFDMAGLPPSAFDTADVVRGPGAHSPSIVDSIGGSLVLHAPGAIQKPTAEFSVSNDPWGGIVSSAKFQGRFGRFSAMVIYGLNDSPGAFGDERFMSGNQSPFTINGNPIIPTAGLLSCNSGPNTGHTTYFYNFCGETNTLAYCCVHYSSQWTQHNGAASLAYDVSPNVKAQVFYVGTQSALNGDPFGFQLTHFTPGSTYTGQLGPGFYNFMQMNPYQLYQHSSLLEEKVTAFIGGGVLRIAALQNNSGTLANHMYGTCLPNGTYTLYGTAQDASGSGQTYTFNGQRANLTFPPIYLTEQFGSNNRDQLVSYDTSVGPRTNVGVSYTKSYYNTFNYVPLSFFGSPITVVCDVNPANSSTLTEYRFNASEDIGRNVVINTAWYIARNDFHTQTQEQVASSPWQDDVFHYSAPRLGVTWRPNINTSYRLAAGGGFAVPSLGQLASQSPTVADNCAQNICSTTIANLALQPEKSFAFDVGSDIRFARDTVASIDLYRANLFGQYFKANTVSQYTGAPVLGCEAPPCPLYISQTKNLGESRYEGLNVSINHNPVKGIYWNASLGLLRAFLVNVPPGFYTGPTAFANCPPKTPTECSNTELIPGINFSGATQSGIPPVPYTQGAATIGYRWGPRTFIDLAPTYFGNGNGYFEPAFVAFDIHTGYPISEYTTLYVTMHNVRNIYGESFATLGVPTMAAPAAVGYPFPLFGIPYGPRSMIVTLNVKT